MGGLSVPEGVSPQTFNYPPMARMLLKRSQMRQNERLSVLCSSCRDVINPRLCAFK